MSTYIWNIADKSTRSLAYRSILNLGCAYDTAYDTVVFFSQFNTRVSYGMESGWFNINIAFGV